MHGPLPGSEGRFYTSLKRSRTTSPTGRDPGAAESVANKALAKETKFSALQNMSAVNPRYGSSMGQGARGAVEEAGVADPEDY